VNRRTQIKFRQLAILTISWLLIGAAMAVYDYLVIHSIYSAGPSSQFSFEFSLAMNVGSALIGSMLGGSFLIFFVNVKYQDKSYGYTLIAVIISFMVIIFLIMGILGIVTVPIRTGKPLTDPDSIEALKIFFTDTSRIKNMVSWSIVVALTQLVLQINSKFGQGALGDIISGKYNTPKEEKRIFMFLDLNSSTTIAERLGDERYHELLKDFFSDITNPILDNNGEIYQYVGDEVIVAWKYEDGVKNSQCVKCFFDIKVHIEKLKEKYLRRYGLVPAFKAGIHCGKVVAGEVGIIKRDITYSGDVLNTTSRILTLCKKFDAEILTSADLIAELKLSKKYEARPLGAIKLRGKEKEVVLSTVTI
jgi:adenylate cyclase